ncbi:MAG: phosphatidate cytidylyltransferase [Rickettsiaceae bacterium]|nr:phosphatidate cytidylyltransferase [Rickettsiaceae bacterium]
MADLFNKTLISRILSGFFLLLIFIFSLFYSKFLFSLLVVGVGFGMIVEWDRLTGRSIFDKATGFALIALSTLAIIIARFSYYGEYMLLWYGFVVATYDSFAYFGGKAIGGKKLAPKISPQKTWAGLFCGLSGSMIASWLILAYVPQFFLTSLKSFDYGSALPALIIGILAQAGDLFESFFKRKYKVKDSGNIIPGHGGLLDRFDSNLLASFALLLIIFWTK